MRKDTRRTRVNVVHITCIYSSIVYVFCIIYLVVYKEPRGQDWHAHDTNENVKTKTNKTLGRHAQVYGVRACRHQGSTNYIYIKVYTSIYIYIKARTLFRWKLELA